MVFFLHVFQKNTVGDEWHSTGHYRPDVLPVLPVTLVSDIAIFVLKRDVKLQPTNPSCHPTVSVKALKETQLALTATSGLTSSFIQHWTTLATVVGPFTWCLYQILTASVSWQSLKRRQWSCDYNLCTSNNNNTWNQHSTFGGVFMLVDDMWWHFLRCVLTVEDSVAVFLVDAGNFVTECHFVQGWGDSASSSVSLMFVRVHRHRHVYLFKHRVKGIDTRKTVIQEQPGSKPLTVKLFSSKK